MTSNLLTLRTDIVLIEATKESYAHKPKPSCCFIATGSSLVECGTRTAPARSAVPKVVECADLMSFAGQVICKRRAEESRGSSD